MKPNEGASDSQPSGTIEAQAELITIGSGSPDGSISSPAQTASTVPAPGKRGRSRKGCVHWPRAILDQCRIAFIAGATLAALSIQHGIPYDTLFKVCEREKWPQQAIEARNARGDQMTAEQRKWVAEQREAQIKRGVNAGSKLQAKIVEMVDDVPDALSAMQLATALEKASGVTRRELGMDAEKGNSGGSTQFAIHASNVNLSL